MRIHGYLAFIVGICITAWVCLFVMEQQDRQAAAAFQRDTEKIARDTEQRLKIYFDTLLSIKAVFAVDQEVTRTEFSRYVRELDVKRRYPGFQAIQFVRRVASSDLESYTGRMRRDDSLQQGGYPNYKIHPVSVRDEHYLIEFNEPMRGNENAFGLDLAALPTHLQALHMGMDSGRVIATERITLVQDNTGQPGFVARAPVYRRGMPLTTQEERRAAVTGFVAIVFRVHDLMGEVIDSPLLEHLYIRINNTGYFDDGNRTPDVDNLMFDSAGKVGAGKRLPALKDMVRSITLDVGGRRWLMQFEGHAGGRYSRDAGTIAIIAISGAVISALIAALITSLQRRRALAQALRGTLEEQRALQDSAIVGIGLFADGVIVGCNRGLEEMMGYLPGGLTGSRTTTLVRGDQPDPFRCAPGSSRTHFETELRRVDGSLLWCMVNGKVLDANDRSKGGVWVISDISDRKRAEAALMDAKHGLERSLGELAQQKANVETAHKDLSAVLQTLQQAQATLITSEKMASLGALVAGIAHELNTPIGNSLLTATALTDMVADFERQLAEAGGVRRSMLDTHLRDAKLATSIIAGSLRRAADLINSFKQVAVDQTSDQRRTFNLCSVVHDTLATYAARMRRANCDVKVEMPENVKCTSYPGAVGQVLSNLINNALLHAFEGRERGRISIAILEPDDSTVELRFRDDGVGMNGKVLHQIYDPFFTTKMGQGGSGLGMNIVYNIVTGVLKGRIEIESEPGKGTLVVLALPRVVGEAGEEAFNNSVRAAVEASPH
jgi:PAS domain S-box-containing protein